jgi:hypothetical protein
MSAVPEEAGPVSVTPAGMVRVPVEEVIVNPFTLVGVIAPSVREIAGVTVGVATDPDTPLAVVTDTLVTVPAGKLVIFAALKAGAFDSVGACPADPVPCDTST